MPRKIRSLEERFWEKVEVPTFTKDCCWLWTAGCNDAGYGVFSLGRRSDGKISAHRMAWLLVVGDLPEEAELDHFVCFNHACVNPAHLRPATRKQNGENLTGVRTNNTSGVRGVYWDKGREKWRAVVQRHQLPTVVVGRFDTIEEAEAAVVAKRNELFTCNELDRKQVVLA